MPSIYAISSVGNPVVVRSWDKQLVVGVAVAFAYSLPSPEADGPPLSFRPLSPPSRWSGLRRRAGACCSRWGGREDVPTDCNCVAAAGSRVVAIGRDIRHCGGGEADRAVRWGCGAVDERPDSERIRAVDSGERATEADDEAGENGRAEAGDSESSPDADTDDYGGDDADNESEREDADNDDDSGAAVCDESEPVENGGDHLGADERGVSGVVSEGNVYGDTNDNCGADATVADV